MGIASRTLRQYGLGNQAKEMRHRVMECSWNNFEILPLFSAGRSRRLRLVSIIQSLAQLEKNYGAEGADILQDNCQVTVFGGFVPNSKTAETLSKNIQA